MKKWIFGFFWTCLILSFYALFFSEKSLDSSLEKEESIPRLVLENFQFFEYDNQTEAKKIVMGQLGYLFEPNRLDIAGFSKNLIQGYWIISDSSSLIFEAQSMKEFLDGETELVSWSFDGHVSFSRKDWELKTSSAFYDAAGDTFNSQDESVLKQKHMDLFGQHGFSFFLKTEKLFMPGFVKGKIL